MKVVLNLIKREQLINTLSKDEELCSQPISSNKIGVTTIT